MTVAEIETRFPEEWILIEDPQTDEYLRVQSGRVLCHSADRDAVYRKAVELRPKHSAFLYTGKVVPDGTVVAL
jgi:hypothetical protein